MSTFDYGNRPGGKATSSAATAHCVAAQNLDMEAVFTHIPEHISVAREVIKLAGKWIGFLTPYSAVLRACFINLAEPQKLDKVLVDVGCGWGEHATLAAVGFTQGGIQKLRRVNGTSAAADEIETAQLLAEFAKARPVAFQRLMSSADVSINLKAESKPADRLSAILLDPAAREKFRELIKGNGAALTEFVKERISPHFTAPDNYVRRNDQAIDARFEHANLFDIPLPDNTADFVVSSSVSSYIKDPRNEDAMWHSILRIAKSGSIMNVLSFEYERDGSWTCAPQQLAKVAKREGALLVEVQNRDFPIEQTGRMFRHSVFELKNK